MRKRLVAAVLALGLTACETAGDMADKDSPSYNAGFGDGCTTAQAERSPTPPRPQRDATLYDKDPDYRRGWNAGHTFCRPMDRQMGF
jgi:hypothetical protein